MVVLSLGKWFEVSLNRNALCQGSDGPRRDGKALAKLLGLLDSEDRGMTIFRSVETTHTKTKSHPRRF